VVFAIKLKRLNHTVTFSTYQKDQFIQLYLHLANVCILTGFEKHYRVGKEIGAGTFGIVYDGINTISHENVALKVISKEKLAQIPHGLHMLHNEIRILQNLRRFHISPLISTYETVDCFVLVLEKGCGGHLFDYIEAHSSSYGEKMLKSIFKQLLDILKILHSAGFIHRDIKP
jgi:serine/threonine protein kinase